MTKILYILLLILLYSCGEHNVIRTNKKVQKFKDGIYCAKIEYLEESEEKIYEYNLNIQVINDKVAVIFDSNEDTLISVVSHSGFLDEYGSAIVSNNGEFYTLKIKGERCNEHKIGISTLK